MRYNTAEDRNYFAAQETEPADKETAATGEKFSHARTLRTIGHALETHRVVSCDIAIENDIYTIKGRLLPARKRPSGLFGQVRGLFVRDKHDPRADLITNRILLRYTMADIRAMEAQVRDCRSAAPEIPDPLSLSQLLRVIGGFMDKRLGEELLGLWIDDRWVTINHASCDNRLLKTTHDVEYFYDLWVKMYLRRAGRVGAPPPSGPTVCIAGRPFEQSFNRLR